MSEKNQILDDDIINSLDRYGFYRKFTRYFEGIIRIGFYVYLIYSFIKLFFRYNILNSSKEIIAGITMGFILFQFFSVNHLIQGIRCFMPKRNKKANRIFTYLSLIGLILLFLLVVYYFLFNAKWIQITHFSLINISLILVLFSYLIYAEFKNIKSV